MSIEGIASEHFSAAPQAYINTSSLTCPRRAVFHSFLSDDSKQDAATNTAHSKRLISLLKNEKVVVTASCLLSSDKKSEILHALDMVMKMN